MDWSSERWTLRRDGRGRQVYFPFGLFGRGFEVRTVEDYNRLRQQEAARRVCFVLFILAPTLDVNMTSYRTSNFRVEEICLIN